MCSRLRSGSEPEVSVTSEMRAEIATLPSQFPFSLPAHNNHIYSALDVWLSLRLKVLYEYEAGPEELEPRCLRGQHGFSLDR